METRGKNRGQMRSTVCKFTEQFFPFVVKLFVISLEIILANKPTSHSGTVRRTGESFEIQSHTQNMDKGKANKTANVSILSGDNDLGKRFCC